MNFEDRKFSADDKVERIRDRKPGHVSRIAYGYIYLVFFEDGSVEWHREDELRKVPEQLSLEDESSIVPGPGS